MAGNTEMSREERLAAKLRENLRRRKAQARAMDCGASAGDKAERPEAGTDDSGAPLSKQAPSG